MSTWILSYAIGKIENGYLGIPYREFLELQLIAVLFFAGMVPVSGALADRFGRRPVLIIITLAIISFGLSFGTFLDPATMGTGSGANFSLMLLFLSIGMALMGLTFGPMSAILPELFPTNVRYTGSGVSYNLSSIFGAALTPFAAVWLTRDYGVAYVGYYLSALACLTLLALILTRETRHVDLETLEDQVATIAVETTSP
jgi:MFS family permease